MVNFQLLTADDSMLAMKAEGFSVPHACITSEPSNSLIWLMSHMMSLTIVSFTTYLHCHAVTRLAGTLESNTKSSKSFQSFGSSARVHISIDRQHTPLAKVL